MNVAYILSATTRYGGGTKSFLTLLDGAMSHGITPTLVVPDREGIYEDFKARGFDVIVLNYRYSIYPYLQTLKDYLFFLPRLLMRKLLNWRASRQLASLLASRHIDLVHTNVSVIDIGFRAARSLGIPHLYHLREYADKDFGMHYFPSKAAFYRSIDKPWSYTVCITKDIQRHHRQMGCPHSRVIYDAVLLSPPPLTFTPTKSFFLFAGRIDASKGLDILLQAYAEADVTIPLYVAGEVRDTAYFQSQQRFVTEHQLHDRVKFLGQVEDLPALMRQALAIIIPSRFEGFGRCMPEAMCYGCLAIGYNTGGTKEQLDNGYQLEHEEIGLRFETIGELSDQLRKVASSSPNAFRHYVERAYHTVCQLYSLEAHSAAIFQYYREIVDTEKLRN